MKSAVLVFLALIAGAFAGAGIAVAWRDSRDAAPVQLQASAQTMPASTDEGHDGPSTPARVGLSEDFQQLSSALMTIDERLSAMELRDEATSAKQKKLLDDMRELAITLEVRSGDLEPNRPSLPSGLEPLRSGSFLPAGFSTGPGPLESGDNAPVSRDGAGDEDRLPEW